MQYKWQYKSGTPTENVAAQRLANEVGLHPIFGSLLQARGITNASEAKKFFRPQLTDLHDPFLMNDMQVAVDRLNQAIGRKEHIMVYGDYDVDGCTAVSLVYRFLSSYTHNLDTYIPDRYDEGYGISFKGIDYAAEIGVTLIIVLDCGIKAVEEIAYAKNLGIDFIICDHHVPDEQLPPAVAILNPKRADNTYPYEHLSGCGVGFKFMQGFAISNGIEFNRLAELLDLCAMSIAADIVPIMGENRILAWHGLRRLNSNPSVGIEALIYECGLADKEITLNDIIFRMGPRINASGRMQNGKEAVNLLVEKDEKVALEIAQRINLYNEARKELDKQMTEDALERVKERTDLDERRALVIYNPEWHKGIIGIVASRLTEQYFRPVVVLTESDGVATGSARSVSGFDVYKAVQSCEDLLDNFGGHTYAAGLSMNVEHVAEFQRRFEAYVDAHISDEQVEATLEIEGLLNFRDITYDFYKQLRRFAPFGPYNERPLFATKRVYDYGTSKVVGRGQEHIKLELVDDKSNHIMNGIAFGQSSQARYIKTRRAFDICYNVEENAHKKGEVQLQIVDIRLRE